MFFMACCTHVHSYNHYDYEGSFIHCLVHEIKSSLCASRHNTPDPVWWGEQSRLLLHHTGGVWARGAAGPVPGVRGAKGPLLWHLILLCQESTGGGQSACPRPESTGTCVLARYCHILNTELVAIIGSGLQWNLCIDVTV